MTGVYKTGLTALTMTVQAMEMDNKNKSIMNSMTQTWKMVTCAARERAGNANVKEGMVVDLIKLYFGERVDF